MALRSSSGNEAQDLLLGHRMDAAQRTAEDIHKAPPGPAGAASNPAPTGRATCPRRFPSSLSASPAPRASGGTAWVMSVIVIGCPSPRKNPTMARRIAARTGFPNSHGRIDKVIPAPAGLAVMSPVLLHRDSMTGRSRRDVIEAAARMARRTPIPMGAISFSSPSSGRNATMMSVVASSARLASILVFTVGILRRWATDLD